MSNSEESNSKKAVENEPRKVTSLNEFLDRVQEINSSINGNSNALFPEPLYRGQSNAEWDLSASLFRYGERFWKHEQEIFQKIIAENPTEFIGMTDFQKLAHIQHHGFPTRLIDVTFNPLVALFFACEGETGKDGEVSVFKNVSLFDEENSLIKLISLLSFRGKWEKFVYNSSFESEISYNLVLAAFREFVYVAKFLWGDEVQELIIKVEERINENGYDFVQSKDIFWKGFVSASALFFPFVGVRSSILNERMKAQQGAFLVCGMHCEKLKLDKSKNFVEYDAEYDFVPFNLKKGPWLYDKIGLTSVIIEAESKEKILHELSLIGIDRASIYPDFTNKMQVLKNQIQNF
ncbi:FRG domain protein [Corynebacterium mustelae]|uniref:FRG domain protein n=1 Tax=Corynebacterium mustelae TaxID=571915 RepID=A0A0G3H1U9_9CORY|nr:FRG domain-containing protein [Corynebacterium mustelae]AKK06705.1 FRG domain protein [Corynebacterium mustelae]